MHSYGIPEHLLQKQDNNEKGTSNTDNNWITVTPRENNHLHNRQYIFFPPKSNFPVRQPHQSPAYLHRHCKCRKVAIPHHTL